MRHLLPPICLALASLQPLSAEPLPKPRELSVNQFIGQFVDLAMFDGTVLIDIGGEVVYERSFGLANYEHGIAHDERTRFRIASVSKTMTDAAFAALVAAGELSLDTPLARYLPNFPSAETITIGHLLKHTSGIPHSNRQPWGKAKTSMTIDEIVSRLASLPLDFEPGTDSSYSNGAYAVAARVLEVVGKAPFGEVMRRAVFDPLGMKDTAHIEDARSPIPLIATGYEPGPYPGERRHARFYAVETRPGGGSLYSTARDVLAFARGVFRSKFISAELRQTVLGADDEPFLAQGRSPGFVAKLLFDQDRDLIVVSLSNNYSVPAGWALAIADLATGKVESSPWPVIRAAAPTVSSDDPRIGHYQTSRGGEQTIEHSARGTLTLADSESESVTGLVPLTDDAFLHPFYFQRCEQNSETREIVCRMLSGDERYTTIYSPLE